MRMGRGRTDGRWQMTAAMTMTISMREDDEGRPLKMTEPQMTSCACVNACVRDAARAEKAAGRERARNETETKTETEGATLS